MPITLTLNEFQDMIGRWADDKFPNSEPSDTLLVACEELGEVCRAHVKGKLGLRGTPEYWEEQIQYEIGDVLLTLAHFCHKKGFTLQECMEMTWNHKVNKDWTKEPYQGGRIGAMHELVGRKIIEVRYMTDEELMNEGWNGERAPVVLVLDNGDLLYPSQDDEGNGPGALFGFEQKSGNNVAHDAP